MNKVILILFALIALAASCKKECEVPANWIKQELDLVTLDVYFSSDAVKGFDEDDLDSLLFITAAQDTLLGSEFTFYTNATDMLFSINHNRYLQGDMQFVDLINNKSYTITNVKYDLDKNGKCEDDYYSVTSFQVNGINYHYPQDKFIIYKN